MCRNNDVAEGLAGNFHFPCCLFLIQTLKIGKPYGFKFITGERDGLHVSLGNFARPKADCLRIADDSS
jgi:hypothetical protein